MDDDFDINLKQATANRKSLPQNMLGALSKREEELLKSADGKKATKKVRAYLKYSNISPIEEGKV